jgi:flagellar protein FlgJ
MMRIDPPGSVASIGTGKINIQQADKQQKEQLAQACQEFEALFWQQILSQMRRSIPKTGLLSGGAAEDIFQSLRDEEYARTLAKKGPGSLALMLYNQLQQEEE